MDRNALISGTYFTYNGHFAQLKRVPLVADTLALSITDMVTGNKYQVKDLAASWRKKDIDAPAFIIYRPEYGNITVLYSECSVFYLGPKPENKNA